jgi:CheY-like chemotaxis protein
VRRNLYRIVAGEPRIFTVVYADDEADVRDAVASVLRGCGFVVHACQDGGEAVAACSAIRPDAVLLDLNMPGTDGFSAAKQIRQLGCAERIVALSGQKISEACANALLVGFDRFLSKPVSVDTLVQALIPAEPASQER